MDVVFGLIPMMLFFGFIVVVVFIWMAKSGHFDDLDGAANSIFMDEEFDHKKTESEPDMDVEQHKTEHSSDTLQDEVLAREETK